MKWVETLWNGLLGTRRSSSNIIRIFTVTFKYSKHSVPATQRTRCLSVRKSNCIFLLEVWFLFTMSPMIKRNALSAECRDHKYSARCQCTEYGALKRTWLVNTGFKWSELTSSKTLAKHFTRIHVFWRSKSWKTQYNWCHNQYASAAIPGQKHWVLLLQYPVLRFNIKSVIIWLSLYFKRVFWLSP